jgi:hypothetical protein
VLIKQHLQAGKLFLDNDNLHGAKESARQIYRMVFISRYDLGIELSMGGANGKSNLMFKRLRSII